MTSNKTAAALAALLLGATTWLPAHAQPRPDWSGTWQGTLVNLPLRPGVPVVSVRAEIGPWPTAEQACTTWRRSYSTPEQPTQVKDYRLCRGATDDEWIVDEGNGVKLNGRMRGDMFVSPFKYDKLILVATTRLRGETLEDEIITIDDKPAVEGPLTLNARTIQRITFRRVSP
ncbi:hypothetical protein [Roseateles toxinivorans]|uniref:Lipocalin-like protein n=1 Tax=Roseateles toxinivorans TaxID=270368 RepID=A0A4R6QR72_9BURK|nr:hypothetical protein [Roseateles toxinivorans]TDP72261.1 hypothetical protein DES47_1026 [Roseateles toxinivorans]